MLIFQKYPHSLPLCHCESVHVGIVPHFDLPLVVIHRQCRIVTGRIIPCIIASVQTDLQAQYIAHDPELVVIRKEGAQKRNGYNILIRTPLQQYPVVQMKSAEAEIFASIHTREAYVPAVLADVAVRLVVDLVGDDSLPCPCFESEIGDRKLDLEPSFILLVQRSVPYIMVRV